MKQWLTRISTAALMAGILPMAVHADDKDVIEYRERVMETLNEQTAALGMILSTAIPDDNAAQHIEAIALAASMALKSFEPKVQGGESRPEVWSNWADFSKRMNNFAKKTALSAKVAREQGKEAALANVMDALDCKSCHDHYRNEKKK